MSDQPVDAREEARLWLAKRLRGQALVWAVKANPAVVCEWLAEYRRETLLEAARLICYECGKNDVPEKCPDGVYRHTMLGFDDRTQDCAASPLHYAANTSGAAASEEEKHA